MDFGHFKNVHFPELKHFYKLTFPKKWFVSIMVIFLFFQKNVVTNRKNIKRAYIGQWDKYVSGTNTYKSPKNPILNIIIKILN